MRRLYKWHKEGQQLIEVTPGAIPELHYVQGDEIPPTMSHATDEGLVFTSRQKLYEHYKQHGFECVGKQAFKNYGVKDYRYKSDINDIRADMHEQFRKIKWGMAPCSEREKESWSREEKSYQDYVRRQSR